MSEFCPRCKQEMRAKYSPRGRSPVKPTPGRVKVSPEYQALVNDVLREKAKREEREKFDRTGRG